jgi:hypothetical protein
MLRHVVMFRWADDAGAQHPADVAAGLDALPAQVEVIRLFQHGPDLGLAEPNFDYVLVAEFDSADDFLIYRNHPAHVAFIAAHITGRANERVAVQYTVG